jgi:hypothetical protein
VAVNLPLCRKCYLPPSSYTQTFTDPNALFPPLDKSYVAPGGRKPTMLTPSGKTYREARALAARNRGTWNPEAAGRDVFRWVTLLADRALRLSLQADLPFL